MTTFNIPANITAHKQDNFLQGVLPKFLLVGFVRHNAFNSDFQQNPYNFQHFNLNYLGLFKDGETFPMQPYQPDFANRGYLREYYNLQLSLNAKRIADGKPMVSVIRPEDFAGGFALFAYNLQEDTGCVVHREGNLRLETRYSEPLGDPINMIVYAVYSSSLEIDNQRDVYMDCTA